MTISRAGSAPIAMERHHLEKQAGGVHAGHVAGAVLVRRVFDDVGADQIAATQAAQDPERLSHREPAGFHPGDRGRERQVEAVQVERQVGGLVADPGARLLDDARHADLLDLLHLDHAHAGGVARVVHSGVGMWPLMPICTERCGSIRPSSSAKVRPLPVCTVAP